MWKNSDKMLLPLLPIEELRLWYLWEFELKELEDKLLGLHPTMEKPSLKGFIKFWREMSRKYWITYKKRNGKVPKVYYRYEPEGKRADS